MAEQDDKKPKRSPQWDHRLVKHLLPDYLADLAELEGKKTELEASLKAASGADDDGEDVDEGQEAVAALSDDELTALKKELATTRRTLKAKQDDFAKKLKSAQTALAEPAARELVLGILYADLETILARYVASRRQEVVAAFEVWWAKYRVTLISIEAERDEAADRLRQFLGGLGYAG